MLKFVKGSASYCLPDQLASKSLFGKGEGYKTFLVFLAYADHLSLVASIDRNASKTEKGTL
jgi:hypothetical protein